MTESERSFPAGVDLTINCAGMINGQIVTVEGTGRGNVPRGTLAINLAFSSIPEGYSIYCASQWTACCSTPSFAVEEDGGINMVRLSRGRYRCIRTFDFGKYGTYDYSYELRLAGDHMRATGVLRGTLNLPEIVGVDCSFTEMMVPVGSREVRSFASSAFQAADGTGIPVQVEGRYTPLLEDDADWTCCARNQIRRSIIDIEEAEGTKLALEYTTVIKGIDAPQIRPARAAVGSL